jgi:hypothetical protein
MTRARGGVLAAAVLGAAAAFVALAQDRAAAPSPAPPAPVADAGAGAGACNSCTARHKDRQRLQGRLAPATRAAE